jgi:hypothetical protein
MPPPGVASGPGSTISIAAAPSPPKIAQQIYAQGIMTKMTVRRLQKEPHRVSRSLLASQHRRQARRGRARHRRP